MSRIAYCPACSAQEHGVKTRLPLEHTCGLETGAINPEITPINQLLYRGHNSNCKACKDEASGIKRFMAAKHTCRKRRDNEQ